MNTSEGFRILFIRTASVNTKHSVDESFRKKEDKSFGKFYVETMRDNNDYLGNIVSLAWKIGISVERNFIAIVAILSMISQNLFLKICSICLIMGNLFFKRKVHSLKVNVRVENSWSTETTNQRIAIEYYDDAKIKDLELKIKQKLAESDDFKIKSLRVKINLFSPNAVNFYFSKVLCYRRKSRSRSNWSLRAFKNGKNNRLCRWRNCLLSTLQSHCLG